MADKIIGQCRGAYAARTLGLYNDNRPTSFDNQCNNIVIVQPRGVTETICGPVTLSVIISAK